MKELINKEDVLAILEKHQVNISLYEEILYIPDKKEELFKELKENSKKMSEIKFPHKYYKAIGTKTCEEIIREFC